jgi:predicted transcriptional regulator
MNARGYQKLTQTTRRRLEKFLGSLELEVMDILWQRPGLNVREVQAALRANAHPLAYTTVMTILGRLTEKGWLEHTKRGRAFHYRAKFSAQETEAILVSHVVRALVQDFGEVAIAQFVKEVDGVDPAQLGRLAALARGDEEGP